MKAVINVCFKDPLAFINVNTMPSLTGTNTGQQHQQRLWDPVFNYSLVALCTPSWCIESQIRMGRLWLWLPIHSHKFIHFAILLMNILYIWHTYIMELYCKSEIKTHRQFIIWVFLIMRMCFVLYSITYYLTPIYRMFVYYVVYLYICTVCEDVCIMCAHYRLKV